MKQSTIITIILVLAIGGAAFYGGMQYQKSQRGGTFNRQGGIARLNGQTNNNFRPVRGQIISADSSSITVKMPDGSSKIVLLNGSISVYEATPSSTQDLKSGQDVTVFGSQNSDGSVTAQNIQIGGMLGGRM